MAGHKFVIETFKHSEFAFGKGIIDNCVAAHQQLLHLTAENKGAGLIGCTL